jgi:hypothetical protein
MPQKEGRNVAANTDEFVIMIGDRPALRLSPFRKKIYSRRLGTAEGQVVIKEGFNEIPELKVHSLTNFQTPSNGG